MIALLSALLGYAGTAATEFFKGAQDKRDKAHELELIKYQAQMDAQRADADLDKTLAQASAAQYTSAQSSYRADINSNLKAGNHWIIGYSASVRPTITYLFFFLYAAVKVAQFNLLLNPSFPWQQAAGFAQALVGIWTVADMTIFEAVIGFWFGARIAKVK